jgi:flagellar biosynthetic protein FliP
MEMRNKGSIGGRRGLVFFCFLVYLVAFFFMSPKNVYASDVNELGITTERADDRVPTVINEPGTATDREDIRELNVSNNLSITYTDKQGNLSGTLRILIILTLVAMIPFLVLMMTSFTRILVVLHFVRAAIGTQTSPPNQVLVGLTLFLTFFIMNPVITQINDTAVKPFEAEQLTQEEFVDAALAPLREFMYPQTQTKDVRLFMDIAKIESVESIDDIPTRVLVPAFVISELRRAFIIGFLIYIPFIVIDMVVASTLMSMGMMMLPPTTISMPFKILLFVLADGWNLVIGNLVKTFY